MLVWGVSLVWLPASCGALFGVDQEQNSELVSKLEAARVAAESAHRGRDRDDEVEDQLFAIDRQLRDKTAQVTLMQVRAQCVERQTGLRFRKHLHSGGWLQDIVRRFTPLPPPLPTEPVRPAARQACRRARPHSKDHDHPGRPEPAATRGAQCTAGVPCGRGGAQGPPHSAAGHG